MYTARPRIINAMRKNSHRKPRPVSKLLNPAQHQRIMMGPWMHLTLLCSGQGTREHVVTVAAAFNIGIALAHLSNNTNLQHLFENAQKKLLGAMSPIDAVVLPEDVATELQTAFKQLDRYLGIQNDRALIRAIDFVNSAVNGGEEAEVMSLPETDTSGPLNERAKPP